MKKFRQFIALSLVRISKFLPKISWGLILLAAYIKYDRESKDFLKRIRREKPWYRADGDHTYLTNYQLDFDSIVFDVGGYIGNSAASIYCKYGSNIHIFEPVVEYVDRLKTRFGQNKKIHIHDFGLGSITNEHEIFISEGATSTFGDHITFTEKKTIKIKSLLETLEILNVEKIDLISINIEGGEYDLLDHIFSNNLINKIRYLQVQFHDISDASEYQREQIRGKLKLTHREKFCFPFVWEGWEIID